MADNALFGAGYIHRKDASGASLGGTTPLYHDYQLLFFMDGRPGSDDSEGGSSSTPEGGGAAAPKKKPKKKPKRKSPPEKSKGDAQATFRIGTLYHVRTAEDSTGRGGGGGGGAGQRRGAGAQTTQRRLDMNLAPGDDSWIRFSDQDGGYRGALRNTDRGAKLESGSGDFAEWQERDPEEEPFGEGDVVAFGENGLTRCTDGAQLLGVISRRAVVTGSMPPPSVQDQWDQVAYCGIVPVKLRGGARKNDAVIPSGKHDGTAIAVSGYPTTYLGRTLDKIEAPSGLLQKHANEACLVEIAVVNPAETVSNPNDERRGARRMTAACFCAALLLVLAALLLLWKAQGQCAPITLPHGKLRGGCEGSSASTCVYDSCEPGYMLLPTTVPHYQHAPSQEARKSVEDFQPCDKQMLQDPTGSGWRCHGMDRVGRTDLDLGWCENLIHPNISALAPPGHGVGRSAPASRSAQQPQFCVVEPRRCTACKEPALGSGWQACELAQADDGGPRMCSLGPVIQGAVCPLNWLNPTPDEHYICHPPNAADEA